MKKALMAGVALSGIVGIGPAFAGGNIALTGHDDDFHCNANGLAGSDGGGACSQLDSLAKFVTNGSSLPILTIDAGTELTGTLTNATLMGGTAFSIVNVAPSTLLAAPTPAQAAALFDPTKYSAIAVASVTSCGGCDNPIGTGTALAAYNTGAAGNAIAKFFNAGHGILGLTAATDANGFAYVPQAAINSGFLTNVTGFSLTAGAGTVVTGIVAVNGDETHNQFPTPGTGGLSGAYQTLEVLNATGHANTPITLAIKNGTESCSVLGTCVISAPEPASMALLGAGMFGLAMARRRRRR